MKILVVDDDELIAKTLTILLTSQTYAVEIATDGEAGWDLIELYAYDLILLDVVLPKLDGVSLCRRVRSHGYQMPILLLTGRDSSHDKATSLDAGADDYVVKPFDSEELVARMRALLRRGTVSALPVLEWGNLRLDPESCQVACANQLLALTPKEYALLELFLRHPQRVFSCAMVLEHLWTFEELPSEDAVRTHIKGLRQKLKAAGEANLIETVYGIGYRLRAAESQLKGKAEGSSSTTQLLPAANSQQTLAAIAGVWEKSQGRIDQQIAVLEQAAAALEQQTLSQTLRQQAIQEAHTLGGSLGIFGLPAGSNLAQGIEHLLQTDAALPPDHGSIIRTSVTMLRQMMLRQMMLRSPQPSAPTAASSISANFPERNQLHPKPLHPKVMIVDDDLTILALLQPILEPWGMALTLLADPQQFWQTLETTAPDLLILDIEMPPISGIDLCQAVRQHSRWSYLPILFLTVHTDAETVNQVYAVGADDFVSKPIVGSELVTRIFNRLERINLLQTTTAALHQAKLANSEKSKDKLELRVAERTAELVSVNKRLRAELNERKQIEEALRVSQVRFSRILDIADDAVISVDGNQRITLFNQGAEKIFGYSAQEAIGQPLDLLLPARYAKQHQQHIADFRQSSSDARRMGERREILGRRKTGEEFPAEASISKLQLKEETVFTVILRDTSDRKIMERMKDEFISTVSHELRTPLTSIHGSLGMLASGLLNAESETGKRLLEIAVDSTERLIRLINDVLDVERIESGKVMMKRQLCNVTDLITQVGNVMQAMAEKFGVTLLLSPLSIHIWADCDRIIQTMTNLLSNAIKFSPQGSTVWLSASDRGEYVLFQVKDQGPGIPADKLEIIFERFQQVDVSDSRNQDGIGLGLSICRNIVQQHGGRIWVESVIEKGSTFYFTLPVGER